MICIQDLWKSFGQQEVLRGISLEVRPGEFVALVGMSGCGKSLLLKHIVKLMRPDRGSVSVGGRDLAALSRQELEDLRSRIGYVFQNGALFDSMSVFDNVAFPLREKTTLTESVIQRKVMEELDHVGLANAKDKFPSQLSGGMMKRVSLARTLVRDPEIVLFDEPTTGLDPIVAKSIFELFDTVHKRLKLTGILVSHEIPEVFSIVQRVAMLHLGQIVVAQPTEEFTRSENPVVDQFVNGKLKGPIQYR